MSQVPADSNEVLTFERLPHAKASGCLVYGLIIPAFAVVLWVVGGMLAAGLLKWLGAGDDVAMGIIFLLGAASLVLSLIVGVRDYRRRATACIRVGPDYVERDGPKGLRIGFADVAWFHHFGSGPLKIVSSRAVIHLRTEEWPTGKIREAFVARVLPLMKARMVASMMNGRQVPFRSSSSQMALFTASGVILLGLGAAALVRMLTMVQESTRLMWGQGFLSLALLAGGLGSLYRAFLERKSYFLEEEGIREGKPEAPLLAWSDFREGRVGNAGLSLTFGAAPRPVKISPLVRSYDLLVALVKSMTPADAWPGLTSEDPAP